MDVPTPAVDGLARLARGFDCFHGLESRLLERNAPAAMVNNPRDGEMPREPRAAPVPLEELGKRELKRVEHECHRERGNRQERGLLPEMSPRVSSAAVQFGAPLHAPLTTRR